MERCSPSACTREQGHGADVLEELGYCWSLISASREREEDATARAWLSRLGEIMLLCIGQGAQSRSGQTRQECKRGVELDSDFWSDGRGSPWESCCRSLGWPWPALFWHISIVFVPYLPTRALQLQVSSHNGTRARSQSQEPRPGRHPGLSPPHNSALFVHPSDLPRSRPSSSCAKRRNGKTPASRLPGSVCRTWRS